MDVSTACLVPRRVTTPEEARKIVAAEGAAVVSGIGDEAAAIEFGTQMLGEQFVRINRQIEVTTKVAMSEAEVVAQQPPDERGRKRSLTEDVSKPMPAHNDGFAFGDYAPNHLFLWGERPAADGGESFLIDGLKLLEILAADPETADLAEFCWTVDIDHSEPNIPQDTFVPIARKLPGGRVKVASHPYLAPMIGPDEEAQWPMVKRWNTAVIQARDTGARFKLEAGEMACVDNYRVFHGRHGYTDPARRLLSIWGWSTHALHIPRGDLNFVEPQPVT
jgi:hypothetical protein